MTILLVFFIISAGVLEVPGGVEATIAVLETLHPGEVIHEVAPEIIYIEGGGLEVSDAEIVKLAEEAEIRELLASEDAAIIEAADELSQARLSASDDAIINAADELSQARLSVLDSTIQESLI